MSKVHDYLTRDLVSGQYHFPPAGTLPYTRFNFFKVNPGKGGNFRKAWEKDNKPVFDKLVADGVVLGYGFAVEEIRTEGQFTHFVWYDTKDLASMGKVRAAFLAEPRSPLSGRTGFLDPPFREPAGSGCQPLGGFALTDLSRTHFQVALITAWLTRAGGNRPVFILAETGRPPSGSRPANNSASCVILFPDARSLISRTYSLAAGATGHTGEPCLRTNGQPWTVISSSNFTSPTPSSMPP
jgi:hypothetical protein